MSLMFNGSVFNQDISNWDVSNVTNMVAMFSGESYEGYHYNPFNHDISGWDVSNVINMSEMFFQDRKSTRLNSSHMAISYAVFCLKKKRGLHHHNAVNSE